MNKLIFDSSELVRDSGKYLSPSFNLLRDIVTIQINCLTPIDIAILSSIDGENWFPISNTNFTTAAYGGLQSYMDCHPSLFYKIECSDLPTNIIILL